MTEGLDDVGSLFRGGLKVAQDAVLVTPCGRLLGGHLS